MFKFHLLRNIRDIVGHLILIVFPILLIAFFNFVFSGNLWAVGKAAENLSYLSILTIGFTLTFQIYGASVSFESLGMDFFTPMRDRLTSTPTEPRYIVISSLASGCIVSLLQTLAIMFFATIILKADLHSLHLILPIMIISILFNQFLGTIILILSKSVKSANIILTIYASIAPMTIGLYFPLPDNAFIRILKTYMSPFALANTAVTGALNGDSTQMLVGSLTLLVLSFGLFLILQPLIRRLAS